MSNQVFANGREISCKAGSGKSIAAFPDVCLSPPSPPAGPIPIPYPLTAMDDDTDGGSKVVKISGDPVMLKDESNFKKTAGDEAATKSLGMGVVTHNITGKVFFCVWSMDVKIEGQNAVRHLDLVTHNHSSQVGQTPPWPFSKRASLADSTGKCKGEVDRATKACTNKNGKWKKSAACPSNKGIKKARTAMGKAKAAAEKAGAGTAAKKRYADAVKSWEGEYDKFADEVKKNDCHKKMRCLLYPYGKKLCCPSQTGDHLIDASCFFESGRGGTTKSGKVSKALKGCKKYKTSKAPCMCVEGPSNTVGTHGLMHTFKGSMAIDGQDKNGMQSLKDARKNGAKAQKKVFKESACSQACIEAQLKKYHEEQAKMDEDTKIKAAASGRTSPADVKAARSKVEGVGGKSKR
jgi:hypothetical protein